MRARLTRRIAILAAFALPLASLGLPSAAHADGGSGCPDLPRAQSFAWSLDPNWYFRMPGGDFEDGGGSWAMTGGARVVSGMNQTLMPASPADSHALHMPSGSGATAAPICVDGTATVMRFFARSEGLAGIATVVVTAKDDAGATQTLLSLALPLTSSWSAPMVLFRLPLLGNGLTNVSVQVHSVGIGAIDVDDFYVDPLRQR